MIHGISSDLASFKALSFRPGLNILLADKSAGATDRQTRNGAGKTSLVEVIHFVLGANADKGSIFRSPALESWTFDLDLDVGGVRVSAGRQGKKPSLIRIDGDPVSWSIKRPLDEYDGGWLELENVAWKADLGFRWFGLPLRRENENDDGVRFQPSFRSLFSYFARRQSAGGFLEPTRFAERQQNWDQQVSISYLLGLDWTISQRLQELRSQEKMTGELRKAAKGGELGRLFEKAADLRTKLTVAEARAVRLKDQIKRFKVVLTCPFSSDHAQLETTTPVAAVDCPSRGDGATGWGAEAPWAAARRPVARAGAASWPASRAANSAGVW